MSALTLESVIVPTKFSKGRCSLMRIFTPHYLNYHNLTSWDDIFSGSQWKGQERPPITMTEGKKKIKKSEKALPQAVFSENPVISFSVLRAMLCNPKRYCTGKPRSRNGFWVFSYPEFQVQTKRYFSLLRGLELPSPVFRGGFWRIFSSESRLFPFSKEPLIKLQERSARNFVPNWGFQWCRKTHSLGK